MTAQYHLCRAARKCTKLCKRSYTHISPHYFLPVCYSPTPPFPVPIYPSLFFYLAPLWLQEHYISFGLPHIPCKVAHQALIFVFSTSVVPDHCVFSTLDFNFFFFMDLVFVIFLLSFFSLSARSYWLLSHTTEHYSSYQACIFLPTCPLH